MPYTTLWGQSPLMIEGSPSIMEGREGEVYFVGALFIYRKMNSEKKLIIKCSVFENAFVSLPFYKLPSIPHKMAFF